MNALRIPLRVAAAAGGVVLATGGVSYAALQFVSMSEQTPSGTAVVASTTESPEATETPSTEPTETESPEATSTKTATTEGHQGSKTGKSRTSSPAPQVSHESGDDEHSSEGSDD